MGPGSPGRRPDGVSLPNRDERVPQAVPPRKACAQANALGRSEGRLRRADRGGRPRRPRRRAAPDGSASGVDRHLLARLLIGRSCPDPRGPSLDYPRAGHPGADGAPSRDRRRTMIDERVELERAVRRFRPEPGIVERVFERRRRQQRNSRIAAAIVAVVIFGATVGGAVAVLRSKTVPVHEPPVGAIQMHNGPIDVFGWIHGIRAIGTDGVGAFIVRCFGDCTEIGGASWSPDGTRLAFDAECAGACATIGSPYHGIHILAPDGDRVILPTEGVGPLAWSPAGRAL